MRNTKLLAVGTMAEAGRTACKCDHTGSVLLWVSLTGHHVLKVRLCGCLCPGVLPFSGLYNIPRYRWPSLCVNLFLKQLKIGLPCDLAIPGLGLCCSHRSVAKLRPTLCDPMNRSTPGLPVHHQLPESTQTHVHRVGDAIQPSHPLSSSSPPAPNPSQNQGLFKWVSQFFASGGQSIGVSASASVLPMNTQDWSPLGWTGWISLQSKGLSRIFSNTTVQKH